MTEHDAHSTRILVCAPIGRDGPACIDLLRRVGLHAELCSGLANLADEIRTGAAAALIAEEALFGRDISELSEWVAQQPTWSDLPFVMLSSRQEHSAVKAWRHDLLGLLRNVAVLERPLQAITLTSTMQAAVRARRRQYEVRVLLEAQERAAHELESLVIVRTRELDATNQELREQMQKRARVEETLRHTQKIEAMGQLTGGVAHDFNNLLMVISGGLEMLERKEDARKRKLLMDGMRQAAERGAALTRQLLAFSRRQALNPETLDLRRHIGDMRELLQRSLGGAVRVVLELAPDLWPVQVNPGELELVILNLTVNARDAMPSGGEILIKAENVRALSAQGIEGDFVRLSIVDTGTGIPPEIRDRIFEPFFTTKEVGKGSGLGLAQVYGFAQQSGGTVNVETSWGRGTTVLLILPRATGLIDERSQTGDHTIERTAVEHAGSVLLVEDNDSVAALVSEMLRELGYEVFFATTAADALSMLEKGQAVDVVFSDIMMPGGMSGMELARVVHKQFPDKPVLLTSGYAEAWQKDADSEGVLIVRKPYQLHELASALHSVTCRSRLQAEGA